jgi:hypothetical protein
VPQGPCAQAGGRDCVLDLPSQRVSFDQGEEVIMLQASPINGVNFLGFGGLGAGCVDATGAACSSSSKCTDIPSGDPYRTTPGNTCVGPDGSSYVVDSNGNLGQAPGWYTTWWGITGILVAGAIASFVLLPHGGGSHEGDGMLHGSRRRKRRRHHALRGRHVASLSGSRGKGGWKVPEGLKVVWSPVNQAYFALWPGRGRIEDQQVLKVANANEMDSWLRDTYGREYGRSRR